MTAMHAGFLVVLRDDIREDDAEHIVNALRMIKGVIDVHPVNSDVNTHIAKARVVADMATEIRSALEAVIARYR